MLENISNNIRLGLLGRDIAHSRSPSIYKNLIGKSLDYLTFDIKDKSSIPSLEEIFEKIDGLSITAPYKKHFIEELMLDEVSRKLQITNCIRKTKSGKFEGTLTDYPAFCEIFDNKLNVLLEGKIIVLGSGSMADMVQYALDLQKIPYEVYSRKNKKLLPKIDLSNINSNLIINCCAREYIFDGKMAINSTFYDFNYNHPHTQLFQSNEEIRYMDGEELLLGQAKHALIYWGIEI